MDVIRLSALLRSFPADFRIYPNTAGNFNVYDGADNLHGHIDVASGEYVMYPHHD